VKSTILIRCWWFTPVILATQETEIRRIPVQSQPRQIVHQNYLEKTQNKKRPGGVAQVVTAPAWQG
jgi:hypothetical protein